MDLLRKLLRLLARRLTKIPGDGEPGLSSACKNSTDFKYYVFVGPLLFINILERMMVAAEKLPTYMWVSSRFG